MRIICTAFRHNGQAERVMTTYRPPAPTDEKRSARQKKHGVKRRAEIAADPVLRERQRQRDHECYLRRKEREQAKRKAAGG